VINTSTLQKSNVFGGPSPESIFKFQADRGVEYIFESCSEDMGTSLYLYDDYLREPPQASGTLSASHCPQGSPLSTHQIVKVRFDRPGEYHIVAEGASFVGVTGNIELRMQCRP